MRLIGIITLCFIFLYVLFPGLIAFTFVGFIKFLIFGLLAYVLVKFILGIFSLVWLILFLPVIIVFSVVIPILVPFALIFCLVAVLFFIVRDHDNKKEVREK